MIAALICASVAAALAYTVYRDMCTARRRVPEVEECTVEDPEPPEPELSYNAPRVAPEPSYNAARAAPEPESSYTMPRVAPEPAMSYTKPVEVRQQQCARVYVRQSRPRFIKL